MPAGKYRDLLRNLGFQSFLWTQFASALNDAKAKPIHYAGRAACEECHAGAYDPPDDAKRVPPP